MFKLWLVSLVCLRDQSSVQNAVGTASAQVAACLSPGSEGASWYYYTGWSGEGRRCSHRGGSRGIKGEVNHGSRCARALQRAEGARGTSTHGGAEVGCGSVRAGFDGTEDGTCASRCWTVLVGPHMPALNKIAPASHPISHPKCQCLLSASSDWPN